MIQASKRRTVVVALLFASLSSLVHADEAAEYPKRVVKIVVGYEPGGAADVAARAVARQLSIIWKRSVIVENRPGADGMLAVIAVGKAAPDGYTLLSAPSNVWSIFPHVYPHAKVNALHDLAPVGTIGVAPLAIAVNPNAPYHTIPQLVAYAKAHPGKVSFGTPGFASVHEMAAQKLMMLGNIKMTDVPYKGAAPASQDLAGGRLDVLYATLPGIRPLVQAGRAKVLAVTSPVRAGEYPDVPSMVEFYPDWGDAFSTYHGIYAPAGTPPQIINTINAALDKALQDKSVTDVLNANGMVPHAGSTADFRASLDRNYKSFDQIFRQVGKLPVN